MAFVRRKGNSIYPADQLVSSVRAPALDLANLFPPGFLVWGSPGIAEEILLQLRPLHKNFQVKLNELGQGRERFSGILSWNSRLVGRWP